MSSEEKAYHMLDGLVEAVYEYVGSEGFDPTDVAMLDKADAILSRLTMWAQVAAAMTAVRQAAAMEEVVAHLASLTEQGEVVTELSLAFQAALKGGVGLDGKATKWFRVAMVEDG
jgi:hypothetical protein